MKRVRRDGFDALILSGQIIVSIVSLKMLYDSIRGNNEQYKVLLDIQRRLKSLKE
jgi:hypothetical protein